MALNVALNTALSGLFANQRAIAATSENIANVNTADFVRRQSTFYTDSIPNQFAGVDVEIARAAVDRFLQTQVYRSNADAAGAAAISEALARVEASLGAPGDNISFANELDEAFAALTTLAANPASVAAKADAVAALDAAFDAFARTSSAVAIEIEAADAKIGLDIDRANALLEEIWRLNAAAPESDGAADLLDARLSELSGLVAINVVRNERGQVEVSTAAGEALVTPGFYRALGFAPGTPAQLTLSSVDPETGATSLINANIDPVSGEIAGLLDARNTDLPRLAGIVETAARAIADAMNAVYAGNVTVGANAPSGAPLIIDNGDGTFSVDAAILADPSQFAIARPALGQSGGTLDGSGATLLADIAATGAANDVAQAVALIGSAAKNATDAAATNETLASELSARAASKSGVNLDEELSNLIVYQRAYSANARVIAAVDELWQSLLSIL